MVSPSRYKIGISHNPWSRRTKLRKETGLDLSLYAMLQGERSLEKSILTFFRSLRLEGEWFEVSDKILHWFAMHRNVIDPGLPRFPNTTPQCVLDKGNAVRIWPKGEGPVIVDRIKLRTGLDVKYTWVRDRAKKRFGSAVRNPDDLPKESD
ncbi:MAG: GIY-YIG nuclease family protein [Pseudomonadota bacterium]